MKRFVFILSILFLFLNSELYSQSDTITIVAFGNSTTAPRKGVEKVYSVRLHESLDYIGIPNRVINSGQGSSHTGSIKDNSFAKVNHGMDRFQDAVIKHKSDWVIINFGLNDAYQDAGINGLSRIPLKKYKKNIRFFIRKIKKQGGRVILLTPNPLGSKYELFRYNQVRKYANCIIEIAKEEKVDVVDSWNLFYKYAAFKGLKKNIDSLFLDGIHPNDTGHDLIADAISEILYFKYMTY